MAALIDTSVAVRYLTNDSPEMAKAAADVVENERDLAITSAALAETAFTLISTYHLPRDIVVDSLVRLVGKQNISVVGMDKEIVIQALEFCRPSGRVSFADALIWAEAATNDLKVYTFDRRFPNGEVAIQL